MLQLHDETIPIFKAKIDLMGHTQIIHFGTTLAIDKVLHVVFLTTLTLTVHLRLVLGKI